MFPVCVLMHASGHLLQGVASVGVRTNINIFCWVDIWYNWKDLKWPNPKFLSLLYSTRWWVSSSDSPCECIQMHSCIFFLNSVSLSASKLFREPNHMAQESGYLTPLNTAKPSSHRPFWFILFQNATPTWSYISCNAHLSWAIQEEVSHWVLWTFPTTTQKGWTICD